MKLNPDCVRDVLIYLEDTLYYEENEQCQLSKPSVGWTTVSRDEHLSSKYLIDDIKYTIFQLYKSGMIEAKQNSTPQNILSLDITDITWEGHELLASLRGEELWKETKSVAQKLGVLSVKGLVKVAEAVMNAAIAGYFASPH